MTFVLEAISELVESGRVVRVFSKPKVINPLTVAINESGKKRLVLDLRHINPHLWKNKCKYEGIECLLDYLKKSDIHRYRKLIQRLGLRR